MPEILVIKGLTSHVVYFKKNQFLFRVSPKLGAIKLWRETL